MEDLFEFPALGYDHERFKIKNSSQVNTSNLQEFIF